MSSLKAAVTATQGEVPWYKELTGYHWWVLIVASLGWLFDTMDQRIFVLVRQPAMEALLPAGSDVKYYSGIATTVFMIGWAVGGLYFGMLSDRWGRAKTMMLAIIVYAGFTGLSALSQNKWDFMAYRFLTGLGVGGEFAAGVTLVAETMPVRARAHALGILQALSAIGNIIGSAIGYFVLPAYGWRAMFCIGVLPSLLVAAVFNRLKEPEAWLQARDAMRRGEKKQWVRLVICSKTIAGGEIPSLASRWPFPEWSACGVSDSGLQN
jgi:MFS family permease